MGETRLPSWTKSYCLSLITVRLSTGQDDCTMGFKSNETMNMAVNTAIKMQQGNLQN